MNNSSIKTQHNKQVWERFWQQNEEIEQVYSNSGRIVDRIRSLGDINGKIVVEVGAGSGRDGLALSRDGAKVILLDYANSSLKTMQNLASENEPVLLVQGDAFNLPFKSDVIDIVFHQGLLEHFENPQDILAENFRVIKKDGFALADVPQRYHLYTLIKHLLIWLDKWFAGWETEFSMPQLKKMFSQQGFQVYETYGEWMRPSFVYRALRETLKKTGKSLPLYPCRIPGLARLRDRIAAGFKKTKIADYTFMDIGVIGRK